MTISENIGAWARGHSIRGEPFSDKIVSGKVQKWLMLDACGQI